MLDQPARDRIRTDLATNLLVEASAGSGKTSSLTKRIVYGLSQGTYDPQRMAAVTFTKKAAAELRGRLRIEIEDELLVNSSERLLHALDNLDAMFIGTIHSFCARLLRQYPVEAGVTPGFREIEEAEEGALRVGVFHRCLEEKPGRELQPLLADAGVRPTDLADALETVCANSDAEFSADREPRPDVGAAWRHVHRFCSDTAPLPRLLPGNRCKELQALHTFRSKFTDGDRETRDLIELLLLLENDGGHTFKWWGGKAVAEPFLARIAAFRTEVAQPFLRAWRAYLYGECMPFLAYVRAQFAAERKRLGVLNFQDQLLSAARLLRESPWARNRLADKFPHVLVDEFQDTDPIQAEVFFRLAAVDASGTDWSALPLRPGALFLVGDPKQSIYRFRRADMEVYNRVRQRLEVLTLGTSFRSVPAVCSWVNRAFASLFPVEASPVQAPFAPLEANSDGAGGVLSLLTDCPRYSDCAALEAPRVAQVIRALHDQQRYAWGDFLVLTWRRKDLSLYADALRQLDVPAETTGSTADAEPSLLELLAILVDPRDSVRLVGVLRGPLFGMADDELYAHQLQGGHWNLWSDAGCAPVVEALATLRGWKQWLDDLPVGAALEKILSASGLLAYLGAQDEMQASALLTLVDRLRLMVESGVPLGEAVLSPEIAAELQPLSLQRAGARSAVRLMNLHQAKGLEARCVFLAAPCGGYRPRVSYRVSDGRGWVPITRPFGYGTRVVAQPLDWEQHRDAELEHLEAEHDRLLYVAATRARQTLVVGRWVGEHGSAIRPWAKLDAFVSDVFEVPERVAFSREPAVPGGEPVVRSFEVEPFWTRVGMKALASSSPGVFSGVELEGVGGAEWGSLVHRLLEHAVRVGSASRSELERLAAWFAFESPGLEGVELAVDAVLDLMERPVWAELLACRERLVEVPVGVVVDRSLVFGVLDVVLAEEGERWSVLDWKTDRVAFEELVGRYEAQVAEYVRAWGQVVGGEVKGRVVGVRALQSKVET